MALSDDVYAWFGFESDMSDSHTGGKDFTENNSPTYSTGQVGNAVDLVRASNMWGSRTEAFPTGSQDLYIAPWIYVNNTTGYHTVFTKPGSYWLHYEDAGSYQRPRMSVYSGGKKDATWGSNLTSATWYFLFGYHDDGTECGLSVDNATRVTNTAATSGIDTGTTALAIGAYASGVHHMDGSIDSLGIFTGDPNTSRQSDLWNSSNGLAYSDFAGGGGGISIPVVQHHRLRLQGCEFRVTERQVEAVRRRLEAGGLRKRHMRPEHFGLRWDVRRGCLWAPAREIVLPRTHDVPGVPRLLLPKTAPTGRAA